MEGKEIEVRFTYHAPMGDQVEVYSIIRTRVKDIAYMLNEFCPESREKSLAITKLEEAVMWANAAIARRSLPIS